MKIFTGNIIEMLGSENLSKMKIVNPIVNFFYLKCIQNDFQFANKGIQYRRLTAFFFLKTNYSK